MSVRCSTRILEGDQCIIAYQKGPKTLVLVIDGEVWECRDKPPFLQVLPCPYCGVLEDKGHEPTLHVARAKYVEMT